jgi:hypothetical protein
MQKPQESCKAKEKNTSSAPPTRLSDVLIGNEPLSSPTQQIKGTTGFRRNPLKMKSCYKAGFETPTGLVGDRDRDLEHKKNRQG